MGEPSCSNNYFATVSISLRPLSLTFSPRRRVTSQRAQFFHWCINDFIGAANEALLQSLIVLKDGWWGSGLKVSYYGLLHFLPMNLIEWSVKLYHSNIKLKTRISRFPFWFSASGTRILHCSWFSLKATWSPLYYSRIWIFSWVKVSWIISQESYSSTEPPRLLFFQFFILQTLSSQTHSLPSQWWTINTIFHPKDDTLSSSEKRNSIPFQH